MAIAYQCTSPAGFPGGSGVKNPPAVWKTWFRSLGWEDPLEEGVASHSSILAWRIPWTEEPGRLQSTGSQGQTGLKWQSAHCQLSGSSSTPSLVAQAVKSPPAVQETWVRSLPGGEKGYPLLSSCLEDSMDRGAWQAIYSPWDRKEAYTTER